MSTNDIESRIRQLLADYRRAVADEIREELLMALGSGRAARKQATRASRGPVQDPESLSGRVRAFVGANPGCSAADVAAHFNGEGKTARILLGSMLKRGKLSTRGAPRHYRYYLNGGSS